MSYQLDDPARCAYNLPKMDNKGNVGVIVLIVVVAVAIGWTLYFVSTLPILCKYNGTCILLPFLNRGQIYTTEATPPEIPRPVIYSEPAVETIDCKYYSIDSIKFSWTIPPGVDGVDYILSENPKYEFLGVSKGLVSEAAYDLRTFANGKLYFSARFKKSNYWGPEAVRYFRLDRTPPEPFDVIRVDKIPSNTHPVFSWDAEDKISGVAYEQIKIGEGDWFNPGIIKNGDGNYVLPEQSVAYSRILTVRAYDFAGNFRDSAVQFSVIPKTEPASFLYRLLLFFTGWWILPLTALAIAFAVYAGFLRFLKLRDKFESELVGVEKKIEKKIERDLDL